MKYACKPTRLERYLAKQQWHRFFCLLPQRMTSTNEKRWLEYVERKGREVVCGWDCFLEYDYRAEE